MSRLILMLFLFTSGLSAQVMDTVPGQLPVPPVQFGYMIRGRIVDGINRKESLHFIQLPSDKYWLWETDKYYMKINMPMVFENTPNYYSERWSNIRIYATLESGNHKIDIPVTMDEEKNSNDLIGKKQYIYLYINGSSLKKKYKNLISENKYWNLKLTLSLKNGEEHNYLKRFESDWSINN